MQWFKQSNIEVPPICIPQKSQRTYDLKIRIIILSQNTHYLLCILDLPELPDPPDFPDLMDLQDLQDRQDPQDPQDRPDLNLSDLLNLTDLLKVSKFQKQIFMSSFEPQ